MMAEDDGVHAIAAYVECIKDCLCCIEALETVRAERKPVLVMKAGRSTTGVTAASSHTASLAGEGVIYDAVPRQHGAIRMETSEDMFGLAYAARPRIYPAGNRVGRVTVSGAAGILIADAAADCGPNEAKMPEDAQTEVKEELPFAAGCPLTLPLPALPDRELNEIEAKELPAGAGLAVDVDRFVTTPEEATEAVAALRRNAVLRIALPDIAQKTEAGGAMLRIPATAAAFSRILDNARACNVKAQNDGVLVVLIADEGVDCILNARIDPVFGPVVLFSRAAAGWADQIDSMEINPIRTLPIGCQALDSLILRKTKEKTND